MTDFPYTQVTGKLRTFFDKVQQVGIPSVVDKKWLASIGFTGSNDSTIIPVLKFIDFIDSSGKPIENWTGYRDKSRAGKVLAVGIIKGYSDLFSVYPDAYRRTDDELKAYFSSRTTAGEQVIAKTLTTLKTLLGLANFDNVSLETRSEKLSEIKNNDIEMKSEKISVKGLEAGLTVNINIQLTLPDTTDESVYDKLFASMKKHLLS